MTLQLDGIVGLDITARNVRSQLAEAEGEVEVIVNSPGGSVTEGVAVYNAIRDYRRNGGTVNARVVGMAASMASYIPLAADKVTVEDNTIFMIHEPSTIAVGRKADFERTAATLEGVSQMLARRYAEKTGQSVDEIRALMNEETFYFGEQIVSAGLADSMEPAGEGPEGRDEAVALARAAIVEMESKLSNEREDMGQLAAMLGAHETKQDSQPVVDGESHTQSRPTAGTREILMEKKEGNPAENAKSYEQGVQDGIKIEAARRDELDSYVEAHVDNPHVAEVVAEAKANGKTAWEMNAKLSAAIQKGAKLDGENPPTVATAEDKGSDLSDDDRAAAKMMGMTIEEYIKYGGNK